MKAASKPFFWRVTRTEFIQLCNEKLTCAARDLAEFTKNGINAGYIVALAHKCEDLEYSIIQAERQGAEPRQEHIEEEIRDAIGRICEVGRTIFESEPSKYHDYLMPQAIMVADDTPSPSA
jgi:hypothetical protein